MTARRLLPSAFYLVISAALSIEAQRFRPMPPEIWAAEPRDILTRVYEMSFASPPDERAFLLVDLAQAASPVDRKLAVRCARELFEASLALPPDRFNYRHAAQMNAVRLLAAAGETKEAVELFDRMEAPRSDPKGLPGGDLREAALRALLPSVMKANGREGREWTLAALSKLSAAGNYPYRAAEDVIKHLLRDDAPRAEALYGEAIGRFQKGKDKEDRRTRENFVGFLLAFAQKFQPALERQGLFAAVEAVLAAKNPPDERNVTRLTLKDGRTVSFQGTEERLLYRMLPLLVKHDRERAEKLLSERAQLRAAFEARGEVAAEETLLVIPKSEESVPKIDAATARHMAWSRSRLAAGMAAKDPDRAVSLFGEILDPAALAGAKAGSAAMAEKDPERARGLLRDAESALEKIQEQPDRLQVLTSVLNAYVGLKESERVADLYVAILRLGIELLEKERDPKTPLPLSLTAAYHSLAQATRFAAKLEPEARLAEISRLNIPLLQWHLMIEVAKAITPTDSGGRKN